jgi:hypothetical protein
MGTDIRIVFVKFTQHDSALNNSGNIYRLPTRLSLLKTRHVRCATESENGLNPKVNYILTVYFAGIPTNVSNSSRSSTVKISRAV